VKESTANIAGLWITARARAWSCRIMKDTKIPLIKEYRIGRIRSCLECISEYPFDRAKQRECILALYPDKEGKSPEHREKSIFRGMVIPSLRSLGFIIGYGDYIKLSANARLIIESKAMDDKIHQKALRVVILEIDKEIFHFLDILIRNAPISTECFLDLLDAGRVSERQKKERFNKWCSILEQVGLLAGDDMQLAMDVPKYEEALLDMDFRQKNAEVFKQYLFQSYRRLGREMAGIVNISDLRTAVAIELLKTSNAILTETQFDEMLGNIRFVSDEYIISLGRPMGAEEKLFKYKGEYFRTLSIKYLGR
jgi:hypothetical protein